MEIKIIKIMAKGTLSYNFFFFFGKIFLRNNPLSLPRQNRNQLSETKLEFDRARQGVNSTRTVIMLHTHAVPSATIV